MIMAAITTPITTIIIPAFFVLDSFGLQPGSAMKWHTAIWYKKKAILVSFDWNIQAQHHAGELANPVFEQFTRADYLNTSNYFLALFLFRAALFLCNHLSRLMECEAFLLWEALH